MEKMRDGAWMVTVVMMVLAMLLSMKMVMGGPVLHKVGGSKGWVNSEDVNYTQWSSQEHFYVGDWLIFTFDKRYYNVLEVNKTSYEYCIDREFIKNVTRGGRDVVQLTEARTYYYISSGGYCFHGMRVGVKVEEFKDEDVMPMAPTPSKIKSASSSDLLPSFCSCFWIILASVLFMLSLF